MRRFATPQALLPEVGNTLGTSAWHQVDQQMIDRFAALGGDHQWIHRVGPRADQGPYGRPIAHGFLTLSLLNTMLDEVFQVGGVDLTLNKGLDRLRFISPVPAEARVRATAVLTCFRPRPRGYSEATLHVTVEIEGHHRPAYTVDISVLYWASSVTEGVRGATNREDNVDELDNGDIVSGVGFTALLVAAMRAMESTRDDALIDDPYAEHFVTRSGITVPIPTNWATLNGAEHQTEADQRWTHFWTVIVGHMGVRSRFFDEYFLAASTAGVRQVVLLAAGLDMRAFRLPWPANVELFELDQPKVLEFKDSVLHDQVALPGCARHVVPIDLQADWPEALLRTSFDPQRPTAWLAEGLLPYLPGIAVDALFADVHRLSAVGSWFATDDLAPDIPNTVNQPAFQDVQCRLGFDMAALWHDDDWLDPERWFRDADWQVTALSWAQAADRYGRTLGKIAGNTPQGTLLTARLT